MSNSYANAKIYKILCRVTGNCYVGSTKKSLEHRLRLHEANLRSYKRGKTNYTTSFRIIALGDYEIKLLENFPCESRFDLEQREGYWIRNTPNTVNDSFKSGITVPFSQNKKEYNRQYKEIHKERLSNHMKARYKAETKKCECGGNIYAQKQKNLECHLNAPYHLFWVRYGFRKNEAKNRKFKCECGITVAWKQYRAHKRSQRHQRIMEPIGLANFEFI